MFPQSHQELARARHADLIREATRERLAALAREGTQTQLDRDDSGPLHWAKTVARRLYVRPTAVRTA